MLWLKVRIVQQEESGGLVRVRVGMVWVGAVVYLHKQMRRALSVFLSLLFLSDLFQRTTLTSDHFPKTNCVLSPFLSPGGYCPEGSSAVTSCPAGAIDWLL